MIILPGPNFGILEVPKCGTTWIRHAISRFQIPHRFGDNLLTRKACPRHSPPSCYNLKGMKIVAQVRDPASWAESVWQFHQIPAFMEPGRYYAQAHLLPKCDEPFAAWIERLLSTPGCVSRYFNQFVEPAEVVLRQRKLERDLYLLLNRCGYYYLSERMYASLSLMNVSKPYDFDWCGLREKFVEAEGWLQEQAMAE